MEILSAVLGTNVSTMSIEDCVICNLHFIVQIKQLLNVLLIVLHVISLAYVTNNAGVEPFDQKF